MQKNRTITGTRIVIGMTVIACVMGVVFLFYHRDGLVVPVGERVFDGDSRELRATKVVATLDAPIQKGMNAIWCASFLSAWKTLETDLAKEPLCLQGSPEVAVALGKAADPRPCIPKESMYVAAGWTQKGIIDQITKDLLRKFPTKVPPTFPGISPNSFVAYAYLEAPVRFSLPYFQSLQPLVFTDTAGKKTGLSSFGIRPEDEYAYFALRRQPAILFEARDGVCHLKDCVVDLDRTSQPNQIILAFMQPKTSLLEMLAILQDKIAKGKMNEGHGGLGPCDELLVPDIVWRITHRFAELEGQEFTNAMLKGQRIDVAQQDIQFRLDRSGAELKSEAKADMLPVPTYYVFDRPFILYMKERGAETPYFVVWVDNAELLNKW